MAKRYVEGMSGSRVGSTRCWGLPSCSPLWRRYCHDNSPGNAGPWRRLYDTAERAGAGPDPADGFNRGNPRPRSTGGVSGGLRPVGPMAGSKGRKGPARGVTSTPSACARPIRACAPAEPRRRVHPIRDAQHRARAIGDRVGRLAVAQSAAAGHTPARRADLRLAQEPLEGAFIHP